jgi:hypothetical protein
VLEAHGVSHAYNHLYGMPTLTQQHDKLAQQFTAPFILLRLLTPRDKKYHEAVKAHEPYDRLVRPLPDMREAAVRLVTQAVEERRRAYVLVTQSQRRSCARLRESHPRHARTSRGRRRRRVSEPALGNSRVSDILFPAKGQSFPPPISITIHRPLRSGTGLAHCFGEVAAAFIIRPRGRTVAGTSLLVLRSRLDGRGRQHKHTRR